MFQAFFFFLLVPQQKCNKAPMTLELIPVSACKLKIFACAILGYLPLQSIGYCTDVSYKLDSEDREKDFFIS